jgi:hypothetical protein
MMIDDQPLADPSASPERPRDIIARASRRRRLKRGLLALLIGVIVWGLTLGALNQRVLADDQKDLLPASLEAFLLGAIFVAGALPVGWSVIGRFLLPVPTFFVYLTVFLGKEPPLPFYAAFALAGVYAAGLTAVAGYLAERPGRSMLGSRGRGGAKA